VLQRNLLYKAGQCEDHKQAQGHGMRFAVLWKNIAGRLVLDAECNSSCEEIQQQPFQQPKPGTVLASGRYPEKQQPITQPGQLSRNNGRSRQQPDRGLCSQA